MDDTKIIGICNVHNITISTFPNFKLNNMILSQDQNFFSSMFNPTSFSNMWGSVALKTFTPFSLPFFYINWTVPGGVDRLTSENCLNEISVFLMALWFVKDCSVNSDAFYTYLSDTKSHYRRIEDSYFSNCVGLFEQSIFDKKDFEKGVKIHEKLLKLISIDLSKENISAVSNELGYTVSQGNFLQYNKRNRINRAFSFLQMARSNSFLPTKIAFYICIYECLFTTEISEVSHKVAERVSLFLGESFEEKKAFYKVIKDGYDVRSKYFHGQPLKKDGVDRLKEVSRNLDTLTRTAFNKIINLNDNYFLDSSKHADFLNNIIFK
jgi:hypothetical protein